MNNINIHILNSSGKLSNIEKKIKQTTEKSVTRIVKFLPITDVDIVVAEDPQSAIPEIGIGGSTNNINLVFISIDSTHPNLQTSLDTELSRTIAHELHHAIRMKTVGYGENLLENAVSEGLADHFSMEVFGGKKPLWSDVKINSKIMEKAKKNFLKKNYGYYQWFFGWKKEIPRWTGYALGFNLVEQYLKKNPDRKPSTLYSKPAKSFV